jgi:glycerophosphoryl diester phosphodiesterase
VNALRRRAVLRVMIIGRITKQRLRREKRMGDMNIVSLAHRGASAYAPENTLAAFYKAIETGANGIELDLRRSKDGVIVVIHDATVDRTTNGSGAVAELIWDELRELDAGAWFSPVYAGERIVSFEEFLHFFGRRDMQFAFELKEDGLEADVCRAIRDWRLYGRATVTSFEFGRLRKVKAIDPRVSVGYLLVNPIAETNIADILAIGGRQICPMAEQVTAEAVKLAKSHGLYVRAWGLRDEALMKHVLACGVDAFTINFPDKFAEWLAANSTD